MREDKDTTAPLVSITCIVYNHEPFLRQCLDGFVMQKTSFPFEILIHDDASTDGSADIIKEYDQKYPGLFYPVYQTTNQYSKGIGIISTFLLPRARGKYIALCEGDDYWTDPLKLQKQVDLMESRPEISMCFHSAIVLNEGVAPSFNGIRFDVSEEREYSSTELFTTWTVPTASILYRKDTVLKYRIKHKKWLTRGDIGLILQCSHTGKVWGMKDYMSVYRMHPNGVTYNPACREKETKKLPRHFRCILLNFPLVDPEPVKWTISHVYYYRMKSKENWTRKLMDLFLSFYWWPRFILKKIRTAGRRLFLVND